MTDRRHFDPKVVRPAVGVKKSGGGITPARVTPRVTPTHLASSRTPLGYRTPRPVAIEKPVEEAIKSLKETGGASSEKFEVDPSVRDKTITFNGKEVVRKEIKIGAVKPYVDEDSLLLKMFKEQGGGPVILEDGEIFDDSEKIKEGEKKEKRTITVTFAGYYDEEKYGVTNKRALFLVKEELNGKVEEYYSTGITIAKGNSTIRQTINQEKKSGDSVSGYLVKIKKVRGVKSDKTDEIKLGTYSFSGREQVYSSLSVFNITELPKPTVRSPATKEVKPPKKKEEPKPPVVVSPVVKPKLEEEKPKLPVVKKVEPKPEKEEPKPPVVVSPVVKPKLEEEKPKLPVVEKVEPKPEKEEEPELEPREEEIEEEPELEPREEEIEEEPELEPREEEIEEEKPIEPEPEPIEPEPEPIEPEPEPIEPEPEPLVQPEPEEKKDSFYYRENHIKEINQEKRAAEEKLDKLLENGVDDMDEIDARNAFIYSIKLKMCGLTSDVCTDGDGRALRGLSPEEARSRDIILQKTRDELDVVFNAFVAGGRVGDVFGDLDEKTKAQVYLFVSELDIKDKEKIVEKIPGLSELCRDMEERITALKEDVMDDEKVFSLANPNTEKVSLNEEEAEKLEVDLKKIFSTDEPFAGSEQIYKDLEFDTNNEESRITLVKKIKNLKKKEERLQKATEEQKKLIDKIDRGREQTKELYEKYSKKSRLGRLLESREKKKTQEETVALGQ